LESCISEKIRRIIGKTRLDRLVNISPSSSAGKQPCVFGVRCASALDANKYSRHHRHRDADPTPLLRTHPQPSIAYSFLLTSIASASQSYPIRTAWTLLASRRSSGRQPRQLAHSEIDQKQSPTFALYVLKEAQAASLTSEDRDS